MSSDMNEPRRLLAKAYRDRDDLVAARHIEAGFNLTPDTQTVLLAIRAALTPTASEATAIGAGEALGAVLDEVFESGAAWMRNGSDTYETARDEAKAKALAAASPKVASDTDTPVDPGVEGVREAIAAGVLEYLERADGLWAEDAKNIADIAIAALAAKPNAGMDAGEVEV